MAETYLQAISFNVEFAGVTGGTAVAGRDEAYPVTSGKHDSGLEIIVVPNTCVDHMRSYLSLPSTVCHVGTGSCHSIIILHKALSLLMMADR